MKYLSALLLGAFLCSCVTSEKNPIEIPTAPIVEIPHDPEIAIKDIEAIAENSACAKYKWKDRGIAPKAYLKGMAIVYARSICNPNPVTSSTTLGLKDKDALNNYGLEASSLNTHTLLIGLGMRESSGKHCCGRDSTASNVSSNSAEAGLFQTSFDSRAASPELVKVYKEFKYGGRNCHLGTFSQGVSCPSSDWKTWGTGEGATFQKMAKECPAFAAEYAAITLRVLMRHYGPLRTRAAEFKPECKDMLSKVQDLVKSNPRLCESL